VGGGVSEVFGVDDEADAETERQNMLANNVDRPTNDVNIEVFLTN
jgi:hypothetical protein